MKKLINDPEDIPRESTEGFVAAHPELVRLADDTLAVLRVDGPTPGRVAVVSGGGSGHEPLHTGYVGRGMLDAAVVGAVYTSPTPDAILRTLRQVDGGAGVVVVVKNYAGDRMNAETALELAALDALEVTSVLVDDDVAVPDAAAGRRGVAGTVVVEKVAGAAADRGDGLGDVARIARRAGARTRSMGLATRGPVAPHSGEPGFRVPDDEVELGIGIHGERGRERIAFGPVDGLVDRLVDAVLPELADRGAPLLVIVNGMGSTPLSELQIVYRRVAETLSARGRVIARSLIGEFVTSLDMAGFSLTLTALDDELIALWDAPVVTAALRWGA